MNLRSILSATSLTLLLVNFSFVLFSQDKKGGVRIDGTVYENLQKLKGVEVTLEEGGSVVDTKITDQTGKFAFTLEFDKHYMVIFDKDGYVSKKVEVDTRNVPDKERKFDFSYGRWKVDLFRDDLGVDASILSKPVAKIVYNPGNVQFGIDKKYQKMMKPGLDRLAEAVSRAYEDLEKENEQEYMDFLLAVKDGDRFLKEKDYENALIQYEAANNMRPDEPYPIKQIKKVNALIAASVGAEERYKTLIAQADEAFNASDWMTAKGYYQQALEVKKEEEYPKERLAEIKELIAADRAKSEAEKLAALRAEYDKIIAEADAKFNKKDYLGAKPLYQEAKRKMPKEEYPTTQLALITKLMAQQEAVEREYNKHIAKADKMMMLHNYTGAMATYQLALDLKPGDRYATEKIAEANAKINELSQLELQKQKMAEAEQLRKEEEYKKNITDGDIAFEARQYNLAVSKYEAALDIFSDREYPKKKIKEANQKLAEFEGTKKLYDKMMAMGNRNYDEAKYEQAINNFQQALNLMPDDQRAKERLALAQAQLDKLKSAEEAKQMAIKREYDQHVQRADEALKNLNLDVAETEYLAALKIIPGQEYPKGQLALVRDKRAELKAKRKEEEKQQQLLAKKRERYATTIASADQLFAAKKYDEAKATYQKALSILPDETYPVEQIAKIDSQLAAIMAEAEANKAKFEERYKSLLSMGDKAMAEEKYVEAKSYFNQALEMKPKEEYPKSKIALIDAKLSQLAKLEAQKKKEEAELAKKEEQYKDHVARADLLLNNKDYAGAKAEYLLAAGIFPDRIYPSQKIKEIETTLAQLAKAEEEKAAKERALQQKEEKYKILVKQGDESIAAKNWTAAVQMYNQAAELFPDRTYPQTQLAKIEMLKAEEARLAEEQKRQAALAEANKEKYQELIREGDKLMDEKKFELAGYKYEQAAKLIPGDPVANERMKLAARKQDEQEELAKYHAENDTEFNRQLAKDYPQGKTVKTEKKGNKTITYIIFVEGDRGDEYRKEVYSWGQTFYFKNDKPIDKITFTKETNR